MCVSVCEVFKCLYHRAWEGGGDRKTAEGYSGYEPVGSETPRSEQTNKFYVLQVKGSRWKWLKGVGKFRIPRGKNKEQSAFFHHLTTRSRYLTANCQWTKAKLAPFFGERALTHNALAVLPLWCHTFHCSQTHCSCCPKHPKRNFLWCLGNIPRSVHIWVLLRMYRSDRSSVDATLVTLGCYFFFQHLEVVDHIHTANSAVTE